MNSNRLKNQLVKQIVFAIAIVCITSSCSIEKRMYKSGYHIEWASSVKPSSTKPQVAENIDIAGKMSNKSSIDEISGSSPLKQAAEVESVEIKSEKAIVKPAVPTFKHVKSLKLSDSTKLTTRHLSNEQKNNHRPSNPAPAGISCCATAVLTYLLVMLVLAFLWLLGVVR